MRSAAYAVAYLAPLAGDGWPYDVGDDPSFACSEACRSLGGRLTWGVRRPDLRNKVRPGDVVLFFAAEEGLGGVRDYCVAAWATVEVKVSQLDVWREPSLEVYRGYSNLLVRPDGQGTYVHDEYVRPWLRDWLWRLADPPRAAPKKERWEEAGKRGRIDNGLIDVDGWRVCPAATTSFSALSNPARS